MEILVLPFNEPTPFVQQGDLSRDKLYERAENQIQTLRRRLAERPKRLPENADLSYLTDWLLGLRGWTTAQH